MPPSLVRFFSRQIGAVSPQAQRQAPDRREAVPEFNNARARPVACRISRSGHLSCGRDQRQQHQGANKGLDDLTYESSRIDAEGTEQYSS